MLSSYSWLVIGLCLCFDFFSVVAISVDSTSAINCVVIPVSNVTCYVTSGMLNFLEHDA